MIEYLVNRATAENLRSPDRGDEGERTPHGSKMPYTGTKGPQRSEGVHGGKWVHGGEGANKDKAQVYLLAMSAMYEHFIIVL